MSANTAIDKQINNYLIKLNDKEKRAVLSVVQTFAENHLEDDGWDEKEYLKEMDTRFKEYETGKVKGLTLQELENSVKQAYKNKKNK